MKKMILAAAVAVVSGFAGNAAPMFEARLSAVAIEGGDIKGFSADARAELEKHLALVAGTKCGALSERALPCGWR